MLESSWPRWVRMVSRYGCRVAREAPSQKFTMAAAAWHCHVIKKMNAGREETAVGLLT